MTDMQAIFKTIDSLTGDELKQLYTYIMENYIEFADRPQTTKQQPRILGLHAPLGKAWLSDDLWMNSRTNSGWEKNELPVRHAYIYLAGQQPR